VFEADFFGLSKPGPFWMIWPRPTPCLGRRRRFLSGFMWPAIFPCGCMGTRFDAFPWWSLWACSRRWGPSGAEGRSPETGETTVVCEGLIRRITMTGRPLRSGLLRKWRRTPMRKPSWVVQPRCGPGVSPASGLDPRDFYWDGSYLLFRIIPTMKVGQAPLR